MIAFDFEIFARALAFTFATPTMEDTGGDDKEAAQRQQLSICLETKMPSDVVAAVLATKTSGGDDDAAAGKVRKVERAESNVENKDEEETAEEEEKEQRDVVDESLTISMLVDEDRESDTSPNDDTKAVAKDDDDDEEEEETQSATIASAKVHVDESARIDDWIATVKRQNRQRTSSVVYYDETMPSLDDLLAAREGWSREFVEEALTMTSSGSSRTTIDPDLDLSFEEYAEVICALLGVPIYKGSDGTTSSRSLIQSLHLVMSLMLESDEMVQDDIFY